MPSIHGLIPPLPTPLLRICRTDGINKDCIVQRTKDVIIRLKHADRRKIIDGINNTRRTQESD